MAKSDQDIVDLNLGWLVTARDLSRNNPEKAAIVLGIDEARMALLSHLTLQELRAIARSGILLLRPRFRPEFWIDLIADCRRPSPVTRLQALVLAIEETGER